jgi:class 3 adenylate cyclase
VQYLGIQVRTGLHTGEVEVTSEGIAGLAVHIGARVMSLAPPGEVMVSSTVKDLVAGANIDFEDCGTHILKGVSGEWRIFSVKS